jgi:hypothetical protein
VGSESGVADDPESRLDFSSDRSLSSVTSAGGAVSAAAASGSAAGPEAFSSDSSLAGVSAGGRSVPFESEK